LHVPRVHDKRCVLSVHTNSTAFLHAPTQPGRTIATALTSLSTALTPLDTALTPLATALTLLANALTLLATALTLLATALTLFSHKTAKPF